MSEQEEREHVIEVARTWIRTPYHDLAQVKGAGCDCATLLAGVYSEAGIIPPIKLPYYSPQWFLHQNDETYMAQVLHFAHEVESPQMADVALYKLHRRGRPVGRTFSHGAIVVSWPDRIIHAHKMSGIVIEMEAFESDLAGAVVRFFSAWPRG
jgi:cell wall-associated NlpC family hydrolase